MFEWRYEKWTAHNVWQGEAIAVRWNCYKSIQLGECAVEVSLCTNFSVFWSRFLICSAHQSLLHHKSSDKRLRCDRRSCSARALTFKAKAADAKSNSAKVQMPKRFIFQTSPRIINKLVGLHFINFSSAEKNSHRMGSTTLWQQSIYRFYLVCLFCWFTKPADGVEARKSRKSENVVSFQLNRLIFMAFSWTFNDWDETLFIDEPTWNLLWSLSLPMIELLNFAENFPISTWFAVCGWFGSWRWNFSTIKKRF